MREGGWIPAPVSRYEAGFAEMDINHNFRSNIKSLTVNPVVYSEDRKPPRKSIDKVFLNSKENSFCYQVHPNLNPLGTQRVPAIVFAAASQGRERRERRKYFHLV